MITKLLKMGASAIAAMTISLSAAAIPVKVSFTADNITVDGGVCFDALCTNGTGWGAFGSTAGFNNWRTSNTFNLDLDAGTHYFAWKVKNTGTASSGNPAALLGEITWAGGANYSSSSWEIFKGSDGSFKEYASEYGNNGGANIWTSVNGGPVEGISSSAEWIYRKDNFADAKKRTWIRTSITIYEVSEPGTIALLGLGLLGLGVARMRTQA